MKSSRISGRTILLLILVSTLVRGFLAAFLEFGNDEVYYWTYALYPDYSHFDHPPMVGLLIQITSLDLLFESEFFIRLGAVLLGALNTWLMYLIGKKLVDEPTGFYAALFYTASVYAFIIAGTFILPDAPQMTFWLLSVYLLIHAFSGRGSVKPGKYILLAGATTGMALLSKYTAVFLLTGVLAYLLIYNRHWFRRWELYVSALIALLLFIPVLYWNYQNDFISFAFQSDRVGMFESGVRFDLFITELGGQIFYNNPVNVIVAVIALISFVGGRSLINKQMGMLLLWISLPLVLLFLLFSLFRHTLPHWTGPAWTTIIFFSAAYVRKISLNRNKLRILPLWPALSLGILVVILTLGVMQIKGGMLYHHKDDRAVKLGEKDVSLDMYGWQQLSDEFAKIVETQDQEGEIDPHAPFISSRWFPAANIDYYLAQPNDMEVLGLGSMDALHKYVWITEARGGFREGMDAWFMTLSRDFRDPVRLYGDRFQAIEPMDTIPIYRNNKHVMNAFFYYLEGMKEVPGAQ